MKIASFLQSFDRISIFFTDFLKTKFVYFPWSYVMTFTFFFNNAFHFWRNHFSAILEWNLWFFLCSFDKIRAFSQLFHQIHIFYVILYQNSSFIHYLLIKFEFFCEFRMKLPLFFFRQVILATICQISWPFFKNLCTNFWIDNRFFNIFWIENLKFFQTQN